MFGVSMIENDSLSTYSTMNDNVFDFGKEGTRLVVAPRVYRSAGRYDSTLLS